MLQNANLEKANLVNANLENANLENASLKNANLKNANLKIASLENSNLEKDYLENASFHYKWEWNQLCNLVTLHLLRYDYKRQKSFFSKISLIRNVCHVIETMLTGPLLAWAGLRRVTGCSRERSTPRFPG